MFLYFDLPYLYTPNELMILYFAKLSHLKSIIRLSYLILEVAPPLFPPAGVYWPMIILSPGVVGTA